MTTVKNVIDELRRQKTVTSPLLENLTFACKIDPGAIRIEPMTAALLMASLQSANERLTTYPGACTKEAIIIATWVNSLC